jgi:hypothetical protein
VLLRPSVDISNETSNDMLLMASFRLSATPISRCGWGGRERQRTEARHVRICAGQLAGEQGDERACGSAPMVVSLPWPVWTRCRREREELGADRGLQGGAVAEGEPLPRRPNGEAGRRR